ncbi:MAG: ABC transporter ATP-binding protein [Aulosira sp. ZfuVER01]|nr:ABC transporter ATP-binding protein [Aulosira sp. ZfuVER01]MDZ8000772.1 ABC transporter ATP-binding protein [Aulosira sp. DedVER01a]MDZ8055081.1 ABC transporter ATP-binding protein [Aulosira sp. ZfuCHP01]
MSDTVIKVENISKKYIISHQQNEPYKSLRDVISNASKSVVNRLFTPSRKKFHNHVYENFWALKDVSFEVKQGDCLGIIGRNGAGKSTLLKILSRITEATQGKILIKGRVASLLEVGTGFHPELTGRENIFLNGAILGMSKAEIKRKFDEIVYFAEVEKFLDTPVKRYSSGMYVRLAFAVAAHLEPEILIVDEVLAVGDTQFQKKCLGKMGDISGKEGRTVLFVSHSMSAVQTLCQKAVALEAGRVTIIDNVEKAIAKYLSNSSKNLEEHTVRFQKPLNAPLWIESVAILCKNRPVNQLLMGETLSLEITFCSETPTQDPKIGFVIYSMHGSPLLNANNRYQVSEQLSVPVNRGRIICEIGMLPLAEGYYSISFWFGDTKNDYHRIDHPLSFEVIGRDIWGNGQLPPRNFSPLWWPTKFSFSSLTETL